MTGQPVPVSSSGSRIGALDGLRGAAALVVVVFHCMIVSPRISDVWHGRITVAPSSWEWWAMYTPLHLLWAGDEAVIVFFVLSGFVLALPFMDRAPHWPSYYARRLVRLYLPVWAALALAVVSVALVPRNPTDAQSPWLHERAAGLTLPALVRDAGLGTGHSAWDGVLWSLHYEVLFSLLLPVYLLACIAVRRWWVIALGFAAGLSALGGSMDWEFLRCMPVFAMGVILAVERRRIGKWAASGSRWTWAALFALAFFLLFSRWVGVPGHYATAAVAAVILVTGFQASSTARRFGETRALRWLGARSFSLYLVHEPVVLMVANRAGSTTPLLPLLVGVPASLVAAAGLYVTVERPAHRLARRAGRIAADVAQRVHPSGWAATRTPSVPAVKENGPG